ncbi:MAG: phosphoribosylformylglycinamidine synthase [Deltaproteobacteria bacterium]|nr:phosphoribosylformylglycinamidine synthase [Deltaproteobacteria bacterium]
MANRIEIGFRAGIRDALGEKIKGRIIDHLRIPVDSVRTFEVYTLDGPLTPEEIDAAARGPLCDPVIQEYAVDRPLASGFDWLIEVGFRPGVTDNVGKTASEAIALLTGKKVRVYTSRQYAIQAVRGRCTLDALTRNDAQRIASELLANELIQRFEIVDGGTWDPVKGIVPYVPRVTGEGRPHTELIDLAIPDEALLKISQERVLALTLEEMRILRDYLKSDKVLSARKKVGLGAQMTDAELECLAQTWSEHCKHKIFNAKVTYNDGSETREIDSLFSSCIKKSTKEIRARMGAADWCLSVFSDNAGIIRFTDDWNLVFKVETHNSPSALDPYGGALTGIVGVNRDPFGCGKGAKLIFNTDVFCFAPPNYDKPLPPRVLHPRRIYEGVREGVEHGGNKSGIPTVNGCIVFDERYLGKPLVYCGTGGILPAKINGESTHTKEILPGDLIVMTGGRIGKDGIHGATFSSEELHEGSPVTAVQIGDPITQKKMTDFLLAARDRGLYRAITDNGAGGLSSSVGETARLSGGCEMDLAKAPLKYPGLNPWEILISESQERMTLAVPPEHIDAFLCLAKKMDCEATVLGTYTDTGWFHIRYNDQTVAYIDMDFLHDGLPQMALKATWQPPHHPEPAIPEPADYNAALKSMLGRLNICSKESVVRQYDHEVQGGSVVKPLTGVTDDGPSDAAVIRPVLDSFAGVVVANGICPRYSDIDAYAMAACAIDEAVRNAVAVGASLEHLAGLDNFCWCDPVRSEKNQDGEYKLAQLVRANEALYDLTTAYGVPCISGKDSMKNDYQIGDLRISIPPTLLFSTLGKIADVRRAVTMDVKKPGDIVYVLGKTYKELGGSEWYAQNRAIGNSVPRVRPGTALPLYRALEKAIQKGLVASCHDCSDGGMAVALAETAFAGGLGIEIDLAAVPTEERLRNDEILFSESQSRFVVTVSPGNREAFEAILAGHVFARIGTVQPEEVLAINGLEGKRICDAKLTELKAAWLKPLAF